MSRRNLQIDSDLALTGGTLTGEGDVTVAGVTTWSGGSISGSGSLIIPVGANFNIRDTLTITHQFLWNERGDIVGSGSLDILPGATLTINSGVDGTLQRTLNNSGLVIWESGVINTSAAAIFNNLTGAVFQIAGDGRLGGNANATLINDGLIVKSGGAGESRIDTAATLNHGVIEVQAGQLFLDRGFNNLVGATLTGGIFIVGAGILKYGSTSSIATLDATLILDGPTAQVHRSDNSDGLSNLHTIAANGHFHIQNGRDFTTAADLSNLGHMNVGPESTLTVGGAYSQDADAILTIGIGGPPAGGQFGAVHVDDTVSLDGSLRLENKRLRQPKAPASSMSSGPVDHQVPFGKAKRC